jgi:4-amino-4-deoxy-L-arabinose transferase-like glycosyltransferase
MLVAIFAAALALRWTYTIILFRLMGDSGLKGGTDSIGYLDTAHEFAAAISSGSVHGWQWLGPNPSVMPLFNGFLTASVMLSHTFGPLIYVLTQCAFDAGTCVLIYGMARTIDRRFAIPAAIAAIINPTQIVLAGVVFTDSLFAFFVALSIFASLRWLQVRSWRWAILLVAALGAAALVRILIVAWVPVLLVVLAFACLASRQLTAAVLRQLAGIAVIFLLLTVPIIARNAALYDTWSFTSQGGRHLALWVAPLVQEAANGTPWVRTYDMVEGLTRERFGQPAANPFVESRRYAKIGEEELRRLGLAPIVKAWLFGAAINISSPALVLSPPIAQLPRTGFYGTPGDTLLHKVRNFLFRSDNILFAWCVLFGIAGLTVARFVQLCGFISMAVHRTQFPVLALLIVWCIFILAINGPIASPKYRLPLEPWLMVMTGAGYCKLRSLWRHRMLRKTSYILWLLHSESQSSYHIDAK